MKYVAIALRAPASNHEAAQERSFDYRQARIAPSVDPVNVVRGLYHSLGFWHQPTSYFCSPPDGSAASHCSRSVLRYLHNAPIFTYLGPFSKNLHLLTVATDTSKISATCQSSRKSASRIGLFFFLINNSLLGLMP